MLKLRVIYIVLLIGLIVLSAFTIFQPMVKGREYSEVQKDQLLRADNEWILQLILSNNEGEDSSYAISVSVDGKEFIDNVRILAGGKYAYVRHLYPTDLSDGAVNLAVYREGAAAPFKRATYYLN